MKFLIPLIGILAFTSVLLFTQNNEGLQSSQSESLIRSEFQTWSRRFGMTFDAAELEYRFQQFRLNYEFIQQHNAQNSQLTLGLTKFAAMSNDEYRLSTLLRNRPDRSDKSDIKLKSYSGKALPESVDWVKEGAVYPTQDQGSCGSCWAFSTIGGLQGLRFIVEGNLELLSAQQVTSCCPKKWLDDKDQGCNGGEPKYAYQYTADDGIEPASKYPYVNGSGGRAAPCEYNKNDVVFKNQGVEGVAPKDVQGMKENLANQPLSIDLDASSIYFQLYTSGVISNDNCGLDLNHAILLVGYQEDPVLPYWTVQNSWGTGWGQDGFGKVEIKEGNGVCGINLEVFYPTSVNQ